MKNEEMTSLINMFNKQNVQYFAGILQRNMDWPITEIERYYHDKMENTAIVPNGKSKHHFMNGIVIKPINKEQLLQYTSLTDGQQRMIVTYLDICAICAYVKNNNIPKEEFNYEKIRNQLLINPDEIGDDKYKLLLRKKDRDTLKMIVDELPAQLNKKAGDSPKIITAYNYLYSQLNKFNYQESFDKLFLMDTLPFVVEPEEDENAIFDSINTGGTKLSLFDKARSFTLSNYNMKKGEILESKYWDELSKDKSPNAIIRMYTLFSQKQRTTSSAYDAFKTISLKYEDMEEYMVDISEFYQIYSQTKNARTNDEDINYLLKGISLIYSTSEYVAIVTIVSYYLKELINKPTLINSLKLLLSVGLRWKLKVGDVYGFRSILENNTMWLSPQNLYNNLYKKLSPFFISDSQFEMVVCDKNFYKGDKQFEEENKSIPSNINNITGYLLVSVENHHYPKGRINFENYSREHICPQTLDNGWEHFFSEETHHDNVHRLGNLTLTAYNSEYSNRSFEEKKNMKNGFNDDKLYLNKLICSYHSWTVDSIQQRTELLAKELCEIFKIPINHLSVSNKGDQSLLIKGGK